MVSIVAEVENALDQSSRKITWSELADIAKLSKSELSHFKKGIELNFRSLFNISELVSKITKKDILKNWCVNLERPKNLKCALEYLALNKYTDELSELINKIRNEHTNRELLDWADAYEILLLYLNKQSTKEILHNIRNYNAKTLETELLRVFIELYCLYSNHEYQLLQKLSDGLEESLHNIKDDYIRDSYEMRIKELKSKTLLYYFNKPDEARKLAEEIISANIGAKFSANSYYTIGMSMLFVNYEECIGNILKYREICESLGQAEEVDIVDNHDIPFVKNVWKKHTQAPQTRDISEIAFYYAGQGNYAKASEIADEAIARDGETGFKVYYKALAENDPQLHLKSIIIFAKQGDRFYAQLPYQHIKDDANLKMLADTLLI